MLKDYETALKYCKIILQYEPNHVTAKEFYPLIMEKLNQASQDVRNSNEESVSTSSSSSPEHESDEDEDEEEGEGVDGEDEEEEVSEEYSSGSGGDSSGGLGNSSDERRNGDSDATTASYSSLEDEEAGNLPLPVRRPALAKHDNDFLENGNNTATSDSESPTEPVSLRILPSVLPVKL
uniref:Glutamate-rich protein 2 n=1 Tax=Lygus hesperus TaxID=30085 RepID=A0A0A9Z976_LYGHE